MKKFFFAALFSASLMGFASCSTGSEGGASDLSISLRADKTSIFADGADAVKFTVLDNAGGNDLTSKSEIYLYGTDGTPAPLGGSAFSTTKPGSYKFYAKCDEAKSSDVTITAVAESVTGITLNASKTTIYPDGGDFSVLTLTNAEGKDVTAQGTFFADGKQLETNRFSSVKGSLTPVSITAMFGDKQVGNEVKVTASSSYKFTARLVLEEITRTSCTYCPILIRIINELAEDEPQSVVAYNIHNTVSSLYSNFTETTQNYIIEACDFFKKQGVNSTTTAPYTIVSRAKNYLAENVTARTFRDLAAKLSDDVAIALESSVKSDEISFKVTVGSKKDFSGKVSVVLVDSGITAEQVSMGYINMYRVMRSYYPSVEGAAKTFATGKPTCLEGSFKISDTPVTGIENCELIAIVTDDKDGECENVQYAHVGEAKGY